MANTNLGNAKAANVLLYHITLKKDIRPSSVRRESELYP